MRFLPLTALLIVVTTLSASGQSFSLTATPRQQEYPVGGNAVFTIDVVPHDGYSSTVIFKATAPTLPSRAISVSKTMLNAPYGGGFVVTINRKNGNLPGQHPIILEGSNGPLMVRDTVYLIVPPARGWSFYHPGNSGLPHYEISSIAVDRNGTGWIGTQKGLARFDKSTWTVYDHNHFGGTEDFVKSVAIDSNGAIWAGLTDGYIVRFKDDIWSRHYVSKPSYAGPTVTSVEVAPNGAIWCVVGNRLVRFEGEEATHYDTLVTLIGIDRTGRIWTWYNQSKKIPIKQFDGTFWTIYSATEIGTSDDFTSFAFDAANTLWGAYARGVVKFNGTSWIDYDGDNPGGFPGPGPWGLDFDRDGALWISNPFHSRGIARYDGFVTTRYTTYNSGLPDDNVTHITAGPDGTVWMAILDGLVLFNPRQAAGVEPPRESRTPVEIRPNPASASSMLHLHLAKPSRTRITLHNTIGAEIARIFDAPLESGEHLLPLDLQAQPSGHYLLRITADGETSTETVTIIK